MYRHRNALNFKSRKLLTSALIQCLFDYSASSWYMNLTGKLKHKLQVAQNKVVRFILDLGPRSHVGQTELDKVGLLNTSDRAKQLMLGHMYNVYNGCAPVYLLDTFSKRNDQRINTRSSSTSFVLPRVTGGTFAYS